MEILRDFGISDGGFRQHYLHLRARIEESGSAEERWWAAVMLGQLFLYDTDKKVRTGFGRRRALVSLVVLLCGWSLDREDFGHSLFCRSKRLRMSSCPEQICAPTH